jgi:alkylresorcinol/alkylpyrone synthase
MPEFDRLAPVFDNAGINKRHSVRPGAWYEEPHSWTDRTAVYLEGATELFVAATRKALDQAGLEAADVDAIVTVSSTGIAAPSLEARAAQELGLGPHVLRVPVFGLGCAGGVAVELCTLAVRLDQLTKANIVALALFGDGAAAAIFRAGGGGKALACITGSGDHTWPDTLNIMGWNVDHQGFGVIFDRSIPPFAHDNLAPAIDGILARLKQKREQIGRFVCHPGGQKVIEAIEDSLQLAPETLDHERAVLADYGNMSAPTALFVLERAIAAGLPDAALLMALGPGFTLSTVMLSRPRT